MVIYIWLIVVVVVAFNIIYHFYLSRKFKHNRNLILSKDYLKTLFEASDSVFEASQGKNSEIFIEDVRFLSTDFKISLDWDRLEQRLNEIECSK